MGDMADINLDYASATEMALDDYVSGGMSMEEAYDNGFLDESGCETKGVQREWDRSIIPTHENLQNELEKLGLTIGLPRELTGRLSEGFTVSGVELNQEAVSNLYKDVPTCNCCRNNMKEQNGKFGKFYFCPNQCKDQSTVSEDYWQKVRKRYLTSIAQKYYYNHMGLDKDEYDFMWEQCSDKYKLAWMTIAEAEING